MVNKVYIVIVAILIMISLLYFLPDQSGNSAEEPVFCTMDALMCPDGSAVGRAAPDCEFRACPYTGPYVGVLQQNPATQHQLILGSIIDLPGEVRYILPLELPVTNVLAEFLNKNITVSGHFQTGNVLVVENLELAPIPLPDNRIQIPVGASDFINGLGITINEITQDNRCPVDVVCVTAGAVTASVSLTSNKPLAVKTVELSSDEAPHRFAGFNIQVVDVSPARVASAELDPDSYILTFEVTAVELLN